MLKYHPLDNLVIFRNVISSFFHDVQKHFRVELVQYNQYLVDTVCTDGLVLKHKGVSNHSAQYPSMRFQLY